MNTPPKSFIPQAVGKPVVGARPTMPAAVGSHAELGWLREQLEKFEHALRCREQAAVTWSGGTNETWKKVAAFDGGRYVPRKKRLATAEKEKRIAVKCRHDVAMCKAVLAIVERSQPNTEVSHAD